MLNKLSNSGANFIVKKLALCLLNPVGLTGVFSVVSETWGTCMFRVSDIATNIEIEHISTERFSHTYTVIHSALYPSVYYAYANIRSGAGFCILLPTAARVIGLAAVQLRARAQSGSITVTWYIRPVAHSPKLPLTQPQVHGQWATMAADP